jgi:RimJ/RimL family protein N-acetyltransferase
MITLRPHERIDIPLRVKWLNNKNANVYVTDNADHVTTTEEQEKWFENYEADDRKEFFTICDDGEPIGFTGLSHIDEKEKMASVFIMIGEDEQRGRGNGVRALESLIKYGSEELGIQTFTLEVFEENVPAVRLYASAGFIKTGTVDGMLAMELSLT